MKRKVALGVALASVFGLGIFGVTSSVRSAEEILGHDAPPLMKLMRTNMLRLMLLRMDLNLTPDQKAEMKKIREAHKGEIAAAAKKVIEAKKALGDEVLAEQPDEQKIRAAASKLSDAIGDAAVVVSKIVPEGRKALTPDQREKIKAARAAALQSEQDYLKELEAK